jgi:hypothetical protein
LDVDTPCNAAAQFALLAGRDKDACVNDERMAETTLAQNWSKYSADDKSQCVGGRQAMWNCCPALKFCRTPSRFAKRIRSCGATGRSSPSLNRYLVAADDARAACRCLF